ncbi:MAG: Gfo/Idh/MocA family protein [Planctomycetota bacterium]
MNVGVISAGRMAGYTMLDLMQAHPAVRPVAWYEIAPARSDTAVRIRQLLDAGIERAADLDALLGRDDLGVILNVTPHYVHADTSIAALEAGHDVLCEKPPACTAAECDAMVAAATRTGRRLLIHFQHLLRPSARWLTAAIRRDELGAIRRVTGLSLWYRDDDYYRRVDWAGRRTVDGRTTLDGTLVNQSIHFLHQMLAMAERSGEGRIPAPVEVDAALYRFHAPDALEMEDTAVVRGTLANADRTRFCFAATTCAAGRQGASRVDEYKGRVRPHRIVVEGDRGRAIWDGAARLEPDGREPIVFDEPEGPWPFYFHLRRVLAGRDAPVTPMDQAVNTMRLIFAAYAAAGDRVVQCPWDHHDEVAEVLAACIEQDRLPAALDKAPAWASGA